MAGFDLAATCQFCHCALARDRGVHYLRIRKKCCHPVRNKGTGRDVFFFFAHDDNTFTPSSYTGKYKSRRLID